MPEDASELAMTKDQADLAFRSAYRGTTPPNTKSTPQHPTDEVPDNDPGHHSVASGALPEKPADFARIAPESVCDSAATPQPFTLFIHRQLRIKLHQVRHKVLTEWTTRILGILNPARLAADSIQVLSAVTQCPILPKPTSGRFSQLSFDFLQRPDRKLWFHGGTIVSDVRRATVLTVTVEKWLLLPAKARKACGKFEAS
jgi:hypothetical protein